MSSEFFFIFTSVLGTRYSELSFDHLVRSGQHVRWNHIHFRFRIFDGSTLLTTGFRFQNRLTPHVLPLTELLGQL
jgi:hypothetical protein